MDNAGMVAMFESLVDTGLKGFLGCPAVIHEAALLEFFANGSVRDGLVVSTVNGVTVEISKQLFAEKFQLPVEGLTDLSEIPKDLVFDARSIVSLSGESVQGTRKPVSFNKLGQPIGEAATGLKRYIGVLAREKVKITYKTWKQVANDIKEFIWEYVNFSYDIDPSWRKGCLTSVHNKWCPYKAHLTSKFILSRLDNPDELNKPHAGYCIAREDWCSFVIVRMSDNFIADELCDDDDINSVLNWKKGRASKAGQFDDAELKKTIEKDCSCSVHVQEIKIDKSVLHDEDLENTDLYVVSKAETLQGKAAALKVECIPNIVAYGIVVCVDGDDKLFMVNVKLLMRPWNSCGMPQHLVVLRDEADYCRSQSTRFGANGHWILTVLEPYKDAVYLLDPLGNCIHDDEWKSVMDMAQDCLIQTRGGKEERMVNGK
ncbi:hypothetical protein F511_38742 [Dorcoceras hygrometricum]|uniref:Uncharacterized protein n=1 Tax=Dorcoceras hygrometricum TaxID=472368 RepID=A0A2Z7C0P4_9LAMI|nr:hypothetical protein F511_38742 [Dorcoceras hygrometricum]